jgi:hypothetical protein
MSKVVLHRLLVALLSTCTATNSVMACPTITELYGEVDLDGIFPDKIDILSPKDLCLESFAKGLSFSFPVFHIAHQCV